MVFCCNVFYLIWGTKVRFCCIVFFAFLHHYYFHLVLSSFIPLSTCLSTQKAHNVQYRYWRKSYYRKRALLSSQRLKFQLLKTSWKISYLNINTGLIPHKSTMHNTRLTKIKKSNWNKLTLKAKKLKVFGWYQKVGATFMFVCGPLSFMRTESIQF